MRWTAHHWLIVEDHTFAAAHRGGRACEVGEDDEGLAFHLRPFEGDDIEDTAVGGEEGEELRAELVLLDLVVEVVDVQGRVGLRGRHGGGGGGRRGTRRREGLDARGRLREAEGWR